jgi:biopolymer transport protein TolR
VLINISAEEVIIVKSEGKSDRTLSRNELGAFARERAELSPDQPMVIAADKSIKYEIVMDVMARLKENGIKRVGLAVKSN